MNILAFGRRQIKEYMIKTIQKYRGKQMLFYLSLLDTEEEKSKFEQIYNQYKYLMFYVANGILKDDYHSEDAVHVMIHKNLRKLETSFI